MYVASDTDAELVAVPLNTFAETIPSKELYDNGEVFEEIYEGNWENGKKHGRGELKITGYWMEDNINSQNENRKRELLEEELSQKFSRNCRCNYFNNSDPRYEMMFPEGEVYTFY